jgi:hypothetical protein
MATERNPQRVAHRYIHFATNVIAIPPLQDTKSGDSLVATTQKQKASSKADQLKVCPAN